MGTNFRWTTTAAKIFDGTAVLPVEGLAPVRDQRIAAIGPRGQVALPDDARAIALSGHWIVPGLIDTQVNCFQSGRLKADTGGASF